MWSGIPRIRAFSHNALEAIRVLASDLDPEIILCLDPGIAGQLVHAWPYALVCSESTLGARSPDLIIECL